VVSIYDTKPRDENRCEGRMTLHMRARQCYFDALPGSRYCPGHQGDPKAPIDVQAMDAYFEGRAAPCRPQRRQPRALDGAAPPKRQARSLEGL
jgi:hypothetical protein